MIRKEYCPTISAFRTHKVAKQKPVPVTIYDYYDSSEFKLLKQFLKINFLEEKNRTNLNFCTARRARVFYEPKTATLCDICEGEDCGDVCVKQANVSEQINENSLATTVFVDINLLFSLYYLITRLL